MFKGLRFYFVPQGIGPVQLRLLKQQVANKGGVIHEKCIQETTVVVASLDFDKCLSHFRTTAKEYFTTSLLRYKEFRKPEFVTESLVRGSLVDSSEFRVYIPPASYMAGLVSNASTGNTSVNRTQTVPLSPATTATTTTRRQQTPPKPLDQGIDPSANFSPAKRRKLNDAGGSAQTATPSTAGSRRTQPNSSNKRSPGEKRAGSESWLSYDLVPPVVSSESAGDLAEVYEPRPTAKSAAASPSQALASSVAASAVESPTAKQKILDLASLMTFSQPKSNTLASLSQSVADVIPAYRIVDDEEENPFFACLKGAPVTTATILDQYNKQRIVDDESDKHSSSYSSQQDDKALRERKESDDESDDQMAPDSDDEQTEATQNGFQERVSKRKAAVGANDDFRQTTRVSDGQKARMDRRREFFVCQKPIEMQVNLNSHITDKLEILEEASRNSGDKWRSFAYRKAISVLRNRPEKITSVEQAKQLRGIGEKIAEKIAEILETGTLRKAELQANDEMVQTLALFGEVFGAGPTTIRKWYAQGWRTLEDLNDNIAALNEQQRIGLKYYYEFKERIPRAEVEKIAAVVSDQLRKLSDGYVLEICGSYRRGKPDCGDMDLLLTHPKEKKLKGLLLTLVDNLHKANILTHDLTSVKSDDQDKYMGVCWYKGTTGHHRIDIQVVPSHEWPFALLYFTGSGHFNRSMRLWARRHGYSLSEHSLVRRFTEEVKGDPILGLKTEKDIFDALGLDYKAPHERDV